MLIEWSDFPLPSCFEKCARDALACEKTGFLPANILDLEFMFTLLREYIMSWWIPFYSMLSAMFSMLLDVAQFWRDVSDEDLGSMWAG